MKPTLNVRYFMAEFYGSFSLLFVPLAVFVLGGSPIYIGLSIGLTYVFTASMLMHISHAHFNPIVSFAAFLDGRMSVKTLGLYLFAQVSGMLFAWISLPLVGEVSWTPGLSGPWLRGFGLETFLIFMLVYVYVAVSEQTLMRPFLPLSVGAAYAVLSSIGLLAVGNSLLLGQAGPALVLAPTVFLRVLLSSLSGTALAMGFYRFLKFQPTVYQSK